MRVISKVSYRMLQVMKNAADLVLPKVCVVCGDRLMKHERTICLHCLADMPMTYFWDRAHNDMADRFNSVIQHGLEESWERKDEPCMDRAPERYAYAAALFFYSHEAPYRHILYNLKYEGRVDVGRYFGRMLGTKLAASAEFRDVDCVIPVPLHRLRRWRRGYNQAEVIAQEVAAALNAPLRCDMLRRKRRTKTQTKLDIKGKAENVAGAFEVRMMETENATSVRHILLIDDVFTTGSTLYACFEALRIVFPPTVRISVATLAFVG